jgi:sporulation protein YqfC
MDRIEDADILARSAELMGLPVDVVAGLPHVELLGNRQIFLSNHKGITSYTDTEIDVNCGALYLRVTGRDLSLISMTGDELRIGGTITSLALEG